MTMEDKHILYFNKWHYIKIHFNITN